MNWIGVDFDKTLAYYSHEDRFTTGPPIKKMLMQVKEWIKSGVEVRIVTARITIDPEGSFEQGRVRNAIWNWCKTNGLPYLRIVCIKDNEMIALYDDKAVQVVENTGEIVSPTQPSSLSS